MYKRHHSCDAHGLPLPDPLQLCNGSYVISTVSHLGEQECILYVWDISLPRGI